ncbi:MAG: hydrolase, partial [Salinivirgaceae bacterium]
IKILYDHNFIYIGIRAFDTEPDKIERQLSRRDDVEGDFVEISFDSYHDNRTAFEFGVSAVGVKSDALISNDGNNSDRNWDPIWYVETNIDDEGWTAEMKIPLTQLRFSAEAEQVWGLEVARYIYRLEEMSQWKLISKESGGWVSQFGTLSGIKNLKPKKEASITPYLVTSLDQFKKDQDDPFMDKGYKFKINGGVNGKFGITNNLTLDMAINPDFGQVEADPSEVNLTAYETFFSEKRPFFIEGSNIMNYRLMSMGDFMSDNLFYSRRIGRNPRYYPDLNDDEYEKRPQNTTILSALKLTGKTKNGWSLGVLESTTNEEFTEINDGEESRIMKIEPLTNYFLARVERDFDEGNTTIGGIFTATNRKLDAPQLKDMISDAYTGGFNFRHQWNDKTYIVEARSVFSHIVGSEEAISETQNNSTHYFNRPNTTHLTFDSTRTSLTGYGQTLMIGKMGKGRIRGALFLNLKSPELELNDIGYQQEADHLSELFWVQYRILNPWKLLRSFHININQWEVHDFDGKRLTTGGNYNYNAQFKNYYHMGFGMNFNASNLSKSALFGGPYLKLPANNNLWFWLANDSRKNVRLSIGGSYNKSADANSYFYNSWAEIIYKPHKMINVSINPDFTTRKNNLQYVDEYEYNNETQYIMARINQKTLRISLRANIYLTPELSIQYWGQPFISAGRYSNFKRITNPLANEYSDRFYNYSDSEIALNTDDIYEIDHNSDGTVDYSFENTDFIVMDFISNLVVRWEYIHGSEIYMVWTQNRFDYRDKGKYNFSHSGSDIFDISPYNVFLIKATYRFSL